jgi:hypothetical protein
MVYYGLDPEPAFQVIPDPFTLKPGPVSTVLDILKMANTGLQQDFSVILTFKT